MKWENLNIFQEMENCIHMFEKNDNNLQRQDALIFDSDIECEHEIQDVAGLYTCIKCGIVENVVLDTDQNYKLNRKTYRPYERKKYLNDTLKRLSGHYYFEKTKPNIEDIPTDINEIRKHLKKNGMNRKNDYYYWTIKNNIDTKISRNDFINWTNEFRKSKEISQKNFLFNKLKTNNIYSIFVPLFRKRKNNKRKE